MAGGRRDTAEDVVAEGGVGGAWSVAISKVGALAVAAIGDACAEAAYGLAAVCCGEKGDTLLEPAPFGNGQGLAMGTGVARLLLISMGIGTSCGEGGFG